MFKFIIMLCCIASYANTALCLEKNSPIYKRNKLRRWTIDALNNNHDDHDVILNAHGLKPSEKNEQETPAQRKQKSLEDFHHWCDVHGLSSTTPTSATNKSSKNKAKPPKQEVLTHEEQETLIKESFSWLDDEECEEVITTPLRETGIFIPGALIGIDNHVPVNIFGLTQEQKDDALINAFINNMHDHAEQLLLNGANPFVTTKSGNTLLHLACAHQRHLLIKLALAYNIDPFQKT